VRDKKSNRPEVPRAPRARTRVVPTWRSSRGSWRADVGAASLEGETDLGLEEYAEEIVASGFPAIRTLAGRARRAQLDGYLARVGDRDLGTRLCPSPLILPTLQRDLGTAE
jgi:hypothetical protein